MDENIREIDENDIYELMDFIKVNAGQKCFISPYFAEDAENILFTCEFRQLAKYRKQKYGCKQISRNNPLYGIYRNFHVL